jgi:hypothetical protein
MKEILILKTENTLKEQKKPLKSNSKRFAQCLKCANLSICTNDFPEKNKTCSFYKNLSKPISNNFNDIFNREIKKEV